MNNNYNENDNISNSFKSNQTKKMDSNETTTDLSIKTTTTNTTSSNCIKENSIDDSTNSSFDDLTENVNSSSSSRRTTKKIPSVKEHFLLNNTEQKLSLLNEINTEDIITTNNNKLEIIIIDENQINNNNNKQNNFLIHNIQKKYFEDIRCFTFFMCLIVMLTNALLVGYRNSVITTIEKRFEFSSVLSGVLSGCLEFGSLIATLFISYFFTKSHIPRAIAISSFFCAIGSFLYALPHFLSKPYTLNNLNIHKSTEGNCFCLLFIFLYNSVQDIHLLLKNFDIFETYLAK
jgi:hypothetical protein